MNVLACNILVLPSISILSKDPNLSRKTSGNPRKRIRFLKRTMVEKSGKGINP